MKNSLIFTLSRPSFPFPPIISTSCYPVLGRVGGVFSSVLSDDVIHFFAGNKKPLRPAPQPPTLTIQHPSSDIPQLRHVL